MPPEQKQIIGDNAGTLVVVAFALVPVVQGIWARFSVWSGRSAAKVAIAKYQRGLVAGNPERADDPQPTLSSLP
jgi:hypothetical protein